MRSSQFTRNALMIVGGNSVGHLAILAASPILSRQYGPEQFGTYGAFIAVLMIVVSVAGLRFELAIPIPESADEAVRLATLAGTSVVTVAASAGVIAYATGWVPGGDASLRSWTGAALTLGVLALGAYQVGSNWSVRERRHGVLATSRLLRSVAQVVSQLTLGRFGILSSGLVIGHVVGSAMGTGRVVRPLLAAFVGHRPQLSGLIETARRFRHFPLYSVPSGLLNSAGNQLPLLLVIANYGLEIGGAFAFSQRVISAPLTMVSQAVGQVFVGEVRKYLPRDQTAIRKLYLGTIVRLAAIGVAPTMMLGLFAVPVFKLMFGLEWESSGRITAVLTPMLLAQFVFLPVSSILNLLGRTRLQLLYDVLRIALGLSPMLVLAGIGQGPLVAIGGYAIGMFVVVLINGVIGYTAISRVGSNA